MPKSSSKKPTHALRTPDAGEAPKAMTDFVHGPSAAPATPRSKGPRSETVRQPDSQTVEQPTVQTARQTERPMVNGRVLLPRKDGQNVRRMTIYMKPDLATELAMARAQTGKDISEMIGEAVAAYLAARRPG